MESETSFERGVSDEVGLAMVGFNTSAWDFLGKSRVSLVFDCAQFDVVSGSVQLVLV